VKLPDILTVIGSFCCAYMSVLDMCLDFRVTRSRKLT